jgi:hypothetical protein
VPLFYVPFESKVCETVPLEVPDSATDTYWSRTFPEYEAERPSNAESVRLSVTEYANDSDLHSHRNAAAAGGSFAGDESAFVVSLRRRIAEWVRDGGKPSEGIVRIARRIP